VLCLKGRISSSGGRIFFAHDEKNIGDIVEKNIKTMMTRQGLTQSRLFVELVN
jgi:hypothetical protein